MKDFEQISLFHWALGGIGLYGRYPVRVFVCCFQTILSMRGHDRV